MTASKGSALTGAASVVLADGTYLMQALATTPVSRLALLSRVLAQGGHYCGVRLSASSSEAVPTSDVSSSNNLYLQQDPMCSNVVRLYDGTNWDYYNFTPGTSVSLSGTSTSPQDVFLYPSGGAVATEVLTWSSDSARATSLSTINGIRCKNGSTTKLYVGTIYTVSNQLNDTMVKRHVWNYYNRRKRPFNLDFTKAGSTAYGTASWRNFDGDSSTCIEFVTGVAEDSVSAAISAGLWGAAGYVAMGLNSSTGTTPTIRNANASLIVAGGAREFYPTIGRFLLRMTEFGASGFNASNCSLNGFVLG